MAGTMYEGWAAKLLRWKAGAESVGCAPTEEEQRQALLAGAAALEVMNHAQQSGRGSAVWRETARRQQREARARLRAVLAGNDKRIDQGG